MARFITASLIWLLASATAFASDNVTLSIEKWLLGDIQSSNARFDVTLTTSGLGLIATADFLQLPAPIGRISNISLNCKKLIIQSEQLACSNGQLAFTQADLGSQNIRFQLTAQPDINRYHFIVSGLKLADAMIKLDVDWQKNASWHAIIDTPQVKFQKLLTEISVYLDDDIKQTLSGWDITGNAELHTDLSGYGDKVSKADITVKATALNVSDTAGQYVTEQVALIWKTQIEQDQKMWQWQTDLAVKNGQAFADPIFLDLDEMPVSFSGKGQWSSDDKQLIVKRFHLKQPKVAAVSGQFELTKGAISFAYVTLDNADISVLYQHWIQPFLTGTAADNLELIGQIGFNYQQRNADYQLLLSLDDVFIDDLTQKFGISGVSGDLAWTNGQTEMTTDISWQGGYVYQLPIAASSFRAEIVSSTLSLDKTWHFPILDGELQLNQLQLNRPDGEHTTWSFDGLLTPISMESLSTALGWPILHGKLSGVIPKVSYANHKVDVDGALMVKLFDGTTVIRDLQLTTPFGALPQLYASIDIFGLDLETLTSTFDFGKITGKLDGKVHNLRLSNWQPVQFDAQFATPEGDTSRRKISQRAVDNLSQLGGGASGVLSRSFLRFFEDFSYQRLGLSCKLLNNVCQMTGVGETETGYYIVKGGGLPPRINVVGYTRQVDWSDLIERLKAVQNSSGPVIQ